MGAKAPQPETRTKLVGRLLTIDEIDSLAGGYMTCDEDKHPPGYHQYGGSYSQDGGFYSQGAGIYDMDCGS